LILSCSSEKKQLETIRGLAKNDIITFLQLPEGTSFADKDSVITEKASEIRESGVSYLVKSAIVSQDRDGNKKIETHTIEYVKFGDEGLSAAYYELKPFD
jgi:hypothetical protein